MIPQFLAEDEENTSSMAHRRVFRDLDDHPDCYDDLELVRRFRFSRASISQITEQIANYLNFTERSYAAPPHLQVCAALQFFASGTFQIISGDGINGNAEYVLHKYRKMSYTNSGICFTDFEV